LRRVSSNAEELADRANAAGIRLVYPGQDMLDELAEALDSFPPDAIREGLKVRDGRAYQTLKERGMIVKRNYENRFEIAKLLIIASKMGESEREAVLGAIASGAVPGPIPASTLDETGRARLARFMRRCGLACAISGAELHPVPDEAAGPAPAKEIRISMPNRSVWVSESSRERLEANLRKMERLNACIQLKNAERQIKVFSEEEESTFASLQKEYLDLLKEQDEVLREFNEEDTISSGL
jgi:hypothetical protein